MKRAAIVKIVLAAYFSWADNAVLAEDVDAVTSPSGIAPGNVRQLAGWVQQQTGGDLFWDINLGYSSFFVLPARYRGILVTAPSLRYPRLEKRMACSGWRSAM